VVNYFFFRVPGDTGLDKRLEKHGIMIRNCSNYVNLSDDYFRVAVKSHKENEKLLAALKEELRR
jgi:histidinol-phosphate/aromatic aminotransferase/cobyric acid decarboxylase-like protein